MTALIGGSVLLIVGAALALVFGWAGADETLIWTSIAASVGAAICLALAYYRSTQEAARMSREAARAERGSARREEPSGAAPAPTPGPVRPQPAETQPTPIVAPIDEGESVVAYPDRARYHRSECRFAQVRGGERISKAAAERRGYDACRVCDP